jgi:hypothetical protein
LAASQRDFHFTYQHHARFVSNSSPFSLDFVCATHQGFFPSRLVPGANTDQAVVTFDIDAGFKKQKCAFRSSTINETL